MKIAVSSKGINLDSPVEPHFGRAAYLLIVDDSSLKFEVIDNSKNVNAFKGSGIQTATAVSNKGAEVLLTGFCGPNAFKTLQAAGIKVVNDVTGTVKAAVAAFSEGKYSFADGANVDGQW